MIGREELKNWHEGRSNVVLALKETVDLVDHMGQENGIREAACLLPSGVVVNLTDQDQDHLSNGINWLLVLELDLPPQRLCNLPPEP